MKYSNSTTGFYDHETHGENIPADAVEISPEQYSALLNGQASGKLISVDADGQVVLVDPPAPTREQILADAQAARAAAYRAEADPLFFKSQRGECTVEKWKAKVEEIKARIPDPA